MDQAVLVGHRQAARHLPQQAGLLLEIQLRGEAVQRVALDQLHHDGRRFGFIEHREHGDDGRVGQARRFCAPRRARGGGLVSSAWRRSTLRATRRPSFSSCAAYTTPRLPSPSLRSMRKPGRRGAALLLRWLRRLGAGGDSPDAQARLDAFPDLLPQGRRQGGDEILHRGASAGAGLRRKTSAWAAAFIATVPCRARVAARCPASSLLFGGRPQEAAGFLVGPEQGFNLAAQSGVVGALLGDKPGASRADGEFQRLRKHGFCLGCRGVP